MSKNGKDEALELAQAILADDGQWMESTLKLARAIVNDRYNNRRPPQPAGGDCACGQKIDAKPWESGQRKCFACWMRDRRG